MLETKQPLYLLSEYRQYLSLYVKVCVVAGVCIVGLTFLMPQTWSATTTLMPPESSGGGGLSAFLQGSQLPFGILGTENKTALVFVEILRSRTVVERVVDSLDLTKHPLYAKLLREDIVAGLLKSITVDSRKTGVVTVDVDVSTGWLPFGEKSVLASKAASDIANSMCTSLDAINREKAISQARKTRQYVERVLLSTRSTIDSLQTVLEDFQRAHKIIALDDQMTAVVTNAVTIGAELAKAELELALVQEDFTASSPQVSLLQRKVQALRQQYTRVQDGGLVKSDGFSIPLNQAPQLMRAYANLLRDLKIREQINAFLEAQRMQELIQEAKDIPTVLALDEARPSRVRSSPSRLLMLVLTLTMITLFFAVLVPLRGVFAKRNARVPVTRDLA
ncbi:MAG: Wzz/FepE/Etk N-terminal domain-containing protein [bacterium]|nr:Wzz/FepE/Etk N-terminal domain-containing protein [bacterium]